MPFFLSLLIFIDTIFESMSSNYLFIFCSGFTFAVGGINLVIGLSNLKDRSYLYFGLLSLIASIFLFSQISSIFDQIFAGFSDVINIFTAATFYALFLWFIGEYTDFKKTKIQLAITIVLGIDVLLYFLVKSSIVTLQIWELLAHITILSISIYGIVAGIKGLKEINILWKSIYILMMVMLFFLTIIVGLNLGFDIHLIFYPEGFVSLDFFPVFFSIIIGSKMSHDVVRSYQLESEIKQKEREWSTLMETINLLIVKLDLNGYIIWINSYFLDFSGYKSDDLLGKNWFDLPLTKGKKDKVISSFRNFTKGKILAVFQNHIKLHNGSLKNIQWSNLPLNDVNGKITGVLSIGADVTERESALEEINKLKDQLEKENLLLKEEVKWQNYSNEIIGESEALMYVIKRSHQVSGTDSSVLLEGETGVGKELFANLIHQNSMRKHKPFIKVNCASLPKELIESELFGHEKGSFTGAVRTRQGRFELADKGTIFLDEIGDLPLDLQPKLLRVLQSGEFERIGSEKTKRVDVRIVAATNKDLLYESNMGLFRQDLFFRLNVYPITIPPLRQRKEDIPILIRHFTEKIGRKIGRRIKQISRADIIKLQDYDWPGNIRELENVLERAIISSEGDTIKLDDNQLKSSLSKNIIRNPIKNSITKLSDSQKNHIIKVLEECEWKINGDEGAANKLGMPPSTLRSKMKKLGIVRR